MFCVLCNKEIGSSNNHFKKIHNTTIKEYYDKYLRKPGEGICPTCGKETKFTTKHKNKYYSVCCSSDCYSKYVSNKFKNWWKSTNKKTIEIRNSNVSKKLKETIKIKKDNNSYNGYSYFKNMTKEERLKLNKNLKELYKNENVKNEIVKKRKNTNKKNYNDENYNNTLKNKQTKLLNHNDENYNNREKYIETCKKIYNTDSHNKLDSVKIKKENTCLKHYGVTNPSKSIEIRKKQGTKYTYKGIKFDSSWEIAYYIWLTDNNVRFEYQPTSFQYYWCGDNDYHNYYVDFKVFNTFIEIKSPHLYKKMLIEGTKNNAKLKCMNDNNVIIITDCSKYIKYVKQKYGATYLKSFKNKRVIKCV